MAPTPALPPTVPAAPPRCTPGVPGRPLGPAARLEAWWWTGPLGHLVAGASDLVPLFARYWLHVARQRLRLRWARLARLARRR